MFQSFKKIIALFLIISINWSAISAIGGTVAYFNDTEVSKNNIFQAGKLDFSLEGDGIEEYDFEMEDNATTTITIIDSSSLDFQYTASTIIINDNNNFCGELDLIAKLDETELYNGALSDFNSTATTTIGEWNFEIENNSTATGTCEFDFVFKGWQEEIINYSGSGFSDIEKISNIISSSSVEDTPTPDDENEKTNTSSGPANYIVINEVYVDAIDESNSEWIELYNPTDHNIDISGWIIDSSSYQPDVTIPSSVIIPAYEFYLIGDKGWNPDNSNWPAPDYYSEEITLTNTNGWAILKNNSGTVIDTVGWGSSAANYKTTPTDEPNEGRSIERGLTGYDSDDNSIDFIIKNNPTPNNSNNDGQPDIVINEFLASTTPSSTYKEFVEIYNVSSSTVSVVDWRVKVQNNSTASSTILTATINAGGYLIVEYDDKNILKASSTITIYDNNDVEVDKIFYTEADIADKSFARIPDGSANWVDPIPTPMETNITEENLELAGLTLEDLGIDLIDDYNIRTTTDDVVTGGGSSNSGGSAQNDDQQNDIADIGDDDELENDTDDTAGDESEINVGAEDSDDIDDSDDDATDTNNSDDTDNSDTDDTMDTKDFNDSDNKNDELVGDADDIDDNVSDENEVSADNEDSDDTDDSDDDTTDTDNIDDTDDNIDDSDNIDDESGSSAGEDVGDDDELGNDTDDSDDDATDTDNTTDTEDSDDNENNELGIINNEPGSDTDNTTTDTNDTNDDESESSAGDDDSTKEEDVVKPASEPEITPEPDPEPEPTPKPEPTPESEPEPTSDPEPTPDPEPDTNQD